MQAAHGLQFGQVRELRGNADDQGRHKEEQAENDRGAANTGKHGKVALAGEPTEPLEEHQGREDPEPLIPFPAQQEEIRTRFEDFAVGLRYGRKHAQGEEERSHSSELGAVAG